MVDFLGPRHDPPYRTKSIKKAEAMAATITAVVDSNTTAKTVFPISIVSRMFISCHLSVEVVADDHRFDLGA